MTPKILHKVSESRTPPLYLGLFPTFLLVASLSKEVYP